MKSLPNILVVDDYLENLIFLEATILNMEANLIMALSGHEALEKCRGIELALAIIDVRMPGMNGYELALKINEERFEFKVPIIFLTANGDDMQVSEGYSYGAVDYLIKPIKIQILQSKINVFLDLFNQKETIIRNAVILKETVNELVRVNAAYKFSEEKYRNYINSAPDGVFVTNEKGRYIEVNEAACLITGYSQDELLNMSIPDLLPKDSIEDSLVHFKKTVQSGSMKSDLRFLHKNGTIRWWNVQAVKLSESRILGFTKDVTQRKETEEALRINQIELEKQNNELIKSKEQAVHTAQKYNELYDFAPTGFITLSMDRTIQELNHSGAMMLGRERNELIGSRFELFLTKNTLPVFKDFIGGLFNNETKQICDVMFETESSQPKYVHIEGIAVANRKQFLLNIVDITNYKQIEQVSKISEEKYKTILNSSPDGVFLINLKGVITEVSEIGIELFGVDSRFELVGRHFLHFIPIDEKSKIREITEKTLVEGLAQNIELKIKKKNQTILLGEISSTLIQDTDGNPLSYMIIIRDISQRKKMETKQIHADRMANLGQMAAGIAHEINQPLNIISLVMDKILFESAKNETIDIEFFKNKSDKIFENIIRIRNIIDHVRAFSRSHDDYILANFDLNTCIENAISLILEQFKHLEIKLDLQFGKNLPQILGNTYQFEQVIINLLANAKDAVIERKSRNEDFFEMIIGIRTYQENQLLIVEVTDNGTGISHDDIDNVMLPFYTTKEEGKGTGLGLSICYQIIKEMGGIIEIFDKGYEGTNVKVTIDIQKKK